MTPFSGDADVLRRLGPFSLFTDTQLTWLWPTVERRSYWRRSVIQRAGEPGDGLYVLLSGSVSIVHEDGDAHELLVTRIRPPEFFGELGLFDGHACAASVRAETDCATLFVPRRVVLECLEENARASMYMLNRITARLCETHAKLAELALKTVEQRVASALLEHSIEAEGAWRVQVGSEQISSLVAASREMVSRVLKRMITEGMVRRDRRKLVVLDRGAVAARASRAQQHAAAAAA